VWAFEKNAFLVVIKKFSKEIATLVFPCDIPRKKQYKRFQNRHSRKDYSHRDQRLPILLNNRH
jgi:hypothetical protein